MMELLTILIFLTYRLNILETGFCAILQDGVSRREKGSIFKMFSFNEMKWFNSNADVLFLRSSL